MPLKLNVGFSRKVVQPDYGSRGASVNLELELESSLISDTNRLQDRVRELFQLARQSVDDELDPSQQSSSNSARQGQNGKGTSPRHDVPRAATQSQVRAIHAIAARRRLDLQAELRDRFAVDRPEDLSITQASELIDAFNAKSDSNGGQR